MYQPVIDYSYLVEIQLTNIPANGQKVPFLDIPQLRNVRTIGCSVFTRTQLALSPNNRTLVTTVAGMVLTLSVGSREDVYLIPCIDLLSSSNSGLIRLFKEKQVNLPKSYITILDSTGLAINEAVCFNFIYRRVNVKPSPK